MAKARKKSNRGKGRTLKKAMPRSKGVRYAPEFKVDCLKLLAAGMTLEAVAARTGVSTVSLCRWRKEAKEEGSYPEIRAGRMRPEATSEEHIEVQAATGAGAGHRRTTSRGCRTRRQARS